METMVWLGIMIVAILIEIATMGLTTIWFAGGALIAVLASAIHLPLAVQIIAFLLVSVLFLVFTRPVAVKYFNKDRVRTNAESLVGRQAIVTTDIDNLQNCGQVTVNGQEWSARSMDDSRIAAGTVVQIMAISGVKLVVKPMN